jgi:GT2 family glycosyltransferase/glycosyltransferase involved in cell wall biosynthesis
MIEKFHRQLLATALFQIGPKNPSRRLRAWWIRQASAIVEASGLFDPAFYAEQNPDVIDDGVDLLRHYLIYGDREGRLPMPHFDPEHYRRSLPFKLPPRHNALLHYLLIGSRLFPETGPAFDAGHFMQSHRDARLNRKEALAHHRDLAGLHGDHFSPFALSGARTKATAPTEDEWNRVLPPEGQPLVDVIVPVHGGRDETLRCLYLVLSHPQKTPFRLVAVNDATPDEALAAKLRDLASRGLVELLENRVNTGFVASANRALLLHPDRDAVLLNADTEPQNNWLDRLREAAYRRPRVATVTPLSNNATICSYPRFDRDNPAPLELNTAELDNLVAVANRERCIAAPTAVGFCMYLRREALETVGLFDEVAFGKGYGEENDFCRRAAKAGWDHRIAVDTYVWHWGARSFKGLKARRVQNAMKMMERRHPGYREEIKSFVDGDPLLESRIAIDEARLHRQISPEGNVLVLMHNRGGGAARLMEEELAELEKRHIPGFLLSPEKDRRHGCVTAFGMPRLPNLPPVSLTCPRELQQLLEKLRISEVHIHQLVDFPRSITGEGRGAARGIATAARRRGLPLDFYVHDYQFICPRINLVGPGRAYCGEPDEAGCRRCLATRVRGIENPAATDIRAWRIRHASLLAQARRVIVPDIDVKKRLASYFPHAHYVVRPHENASSFPPTRPPRARRRENWRIVVPGAISVVKGYDVILATAKAARAARLPLEFIVMGFSRRDAELEEAGVTITGKYRDADAQDVLSQIDADLAWVPSVWPETYCYAMSIPLRAGLSVAAFDFGAQATRLGAHGGNHLLLPLQLAKHPKKLAQRLHQFIGVHALRADGRVSA